MASNSAKSFLADAGYGEQELDANSALMELDKGTGRRRAGEALAGSGAAWRLRPERGRAHAPLCGAGSAAAGLGAGLRRRPALARTPLTAWGHYLPSPQTVNGRSPENTEF